MLPHQDFKILVIDDNPAIYQDFCKMLVGNREHANHIEDIAKLELKIFNKKSDHTPTHHFNLKYAADGEEGVKKIKKAVDDNEPYALAFVDVRMPPGWDGIETIKQIWKLDKKIQIVVCTAYSDYTWDETMMHLGHMNNLLIYTSQR